MGRGGGNALLDYKLLAIQVKLNEYGFLIDLVFGKGMIPEPDYSDSEEEIADDETVDVQSMIKMSPQPIRAAGNLNGHSIAEDGLILPRKISNPCLDSKEKLDLHRELKFNQKM